MADEPNAGRFFGLMSHGKYLSGFGLRSKPLWTTEVRYAMLTTERPPWWGGEFGAANTSDWRKASNLLRHSPCCSAMLVRAEVVGEYVES
jgi:hypothetical protein